MNQHYCFILIPTLLPRTNFGEKKNKVSKAHRLAHRSLCEAQAVEMETYSKFKNNNKILFQN